MDEGEFSTLYDGLKHLIYRYAAIRLSDEHALDIVNETFEVVWRKRDEAPVDSEERQLWCFGIARHKVMQQNQRRLRRPHEYRFAADYAESLIVVADGDIADRVTEADAGRRLWSELSAADQELAVILLSTDWSAAEIAQASGVSYSAHTTRVARLRDRIRRHRLTDVSLEEGAG